MKVTEIILPIPKQHTYSYFVPTDIEEQITVGQRVIVSFGNRGYLTGIVHTITTADKVDRLKPIMEIIDKNPFISLRQLKFWQDIADYYLCSLGDVFRLAIPSILRIESQTIIKVNRCAISEIELSEKEKTILNILSTKKSYTIKSLSDRCGFNPIKMINTLSEKKVICVEDIIKPKYKPKSIDLVFLNFDLKDNAKVQEIFSQIKRAKKQTLLLENLINLLLDENGDIDENILKEGIDKNSLKEYDFFNNNIFTALLERGIIRVKSKEISEIAIKNESKIDLPSEKLSKHSENIINILSEKNSCLLLSESYTDNLTISIDLISLTLTKNKDVLLILPEISYTKNIVEKLTDVFGDKVLEYHSQTDDYHKVETIKKVSQHSGRIIIGVRSSIFLPFKDLGLIIINEEHDESHINKVSYPQYSVRILSIFLSAIHNSKTLFISHTPSIETYSLANFDKIGLYKIQSEMPSKVYPQIDVFDIKEMYHKKRMKGHLSIDIIEAIKETLQQNQKIIIIQNRRGYNSSIECKECGYIHKCKHCDIALTFHKHKNILKCHYCGYTEPVLVQCKQCNSKEFRYVSFGTESLESELKEIFPDTKIQRIDSDVIKTKHQFEQKINDFQTGKTKIIIGTRMITNLLDLSSVSLVVFPNIDSFINIPNYHAFEWTYQFVREIIYRIRTENHNRIIINTYSPDNYIFDCLKNNDYKRFFINQMQERHLFKYPPYCKLNTIILRSNNLENLENYAVKLAFHLRENNFFDVLGPESSTERTKNMFQKIILIKSKKPIGQKKLNSYITQAMENLKSDKKHRSIQINFQIE